MGGHRKRVLEPHRAFIVERLLRPHLSLPRLKQELAARGSGGVTQCEVAVPAPRGALIQKLLLAHGADPRRDRAPVAALAMLIKPSQSVAADLHC